MHAAIIKLRSSDSDVGYMAGDRQQTFGLQSPTRVTSAPFWNAVLLLALRGDIL